MKKRTPGQAEARRARQAATALLPRCACGSIAPQGSELCGHCAQEQLEASEALRQTEDLEARIKGLRKHMYVHQDLVDVLLEMAGLLGTQK